MSAEHAGSRAADRGRLQAFVAAAAGALRRVGRRRVPVTMQTVAGECGVACVAMLAAHHGRPHTLAQLTAHADTGRLGMRLQELKAVADAAGLSSRVVKLHDLEDLRWLDRPVILHWRFCHYVVLERFDGRHAEIVDPAYGRMRIDRRTLGEAYTGLLLWCEPPAKNASSTPGAPSTMPASAWSGAPPPFWSFLRRYADGLAGWRRLLAASLAMQLLAMAPAILSSSLFGAVLPGRDAGLLAVLAIAGVGIGIVNPLLDLLRSHILIELRTQLSARMVGDLFERLLGAQWQALSKRSYGDLLTRLHANDEIRSLLTTTGIGLLLDASLLAFGALLLVAASPAVAAVVAVVAVTGASGIAAIQRRRKEALAAVFARKADVQGFLVQALMGLETVRAGGFETQISARYAKGFGDELAETVRLSRLDAAMSALAMALNSTGALLLLGVVSALHLATALSLPKAMLAFNVAMLVLSSAGKLCMGALHLQSVRFQMQLAQDVIDLPQLPPGDRPARPCAGRIDVRDACFRHAGNAPFALDAVDLSIAPGRFVAVVGASGSGKSTLLSVLAGMHAPQRGDVRLDDAPLSTLDPAWMRERIVLVPQFPFFFSDSIRANLRLAHPDADPAAIRDACARAGIADEIEAMPMGYDTLMGEGGSGLSGGQRQRLALARALLAQPAVLLMDESTSSLDARSEQTVMERIAAHPATRVIAAHRLSTVRGADWIVVLEHGRIVEQGTFSQLSQQAGPFRRLFGRQLAGPDTENAACGS